MVRSSDLKPDMLLCNSTCSLTGQPTYVWYKNDQAVGYGQTLDLRTTKPGDPYKCFVPASKVCSPSVCEFVYRSFVWKVCVAVEKNKFTWTFLVFSCQIKLSGREKSNEKYKPPLISHLCAS